MYICICNAVTERQLCAAIDAGAKTLCELQSTLDVATCCGRCTASVMEYLPNPVLNQANKLPLQNAPCASRHAEPHTLPASPRLLSESRPT